MSQNKKIINCKEKPLLLFSPLDWGLGHTTRSIPLINELLKQGCEIVVACNSTQKTVLEAEFPTIEFIYLDGYDLKYSTNGVLTKFKLALQLKKILTRIKYENQWLASIISLKQIDAVISDNRYGLFSSHVPCIFITHQLKVKSGFGKLADKFIQKFLYRYINKFKLCWVPDFENNEGLAGELSHPAKLPNIPIRYLGCLSRLNECNPSSANNSFENDILIILSGPEPQRTILEEIISGQLKGHLKKVVLVRGLPAEFQGNLKLDGVKIYNHVNAEKLNQLVCNSGLVICRAGYTSIMDMLKLKKKMVVVPTPGQAEQEYLASYLSGNKLVIAMNQNEFSIAGADELAAKYDFRFIENSMDEYKLIVRDFAEGLKKQL